MVDHFKWAVVEPVETYVTMDCPSSDADVKSELDVQALVSFPFSHSKITSYGSIHSMRHPGQSCARDVENSPILRT